MLFVYIFISLKRNSLTFLYKNMLNTYYKNLTKENRQIAVQRIAFKTAFTEKIVERVLHRYNPLIEIQKIG